MFYIDYAQSIFRLQIFLKNLFGILCHSRSNNVNAFNFYVYANWLNTENKLKTRRDINFQKWHLVHKNWYNQCYNNDQMIYVE